MQTIEITKQQFKEKMIECRILKPTDAGMAAIDSILSPCGKIKYVKIKQ